MAYTTDNNFGLIPSGAVDWAALVNDLMNKVEAGRTLYLQTGVTLTKGMPFYVQTDGKAYKATSATKCHGLWQSTATAGGAYGYGQIDGTMTVGTWAWGTLGANIYIDGSGNLTQTPGGDPIAFALSATKINIHVVL